MMAALIPQGGKFVAAASLDAATQSATRESVTDPAEVAPTAPAAIGDAVPSLTAQATEVEAPQPTQTALATSTAALRIFGSMTLCFPPPTGAGHTVRSAIRLALRIAPPPRVLPLSSTCRAVTSLPLTPTPKGEGLRPPRSSRTGMGANARHRAPRRRRPARPFNARHARRAGDDASDDRTRAGLAHRRTLRGSPARAAAFDLLMSYGCDENLAQTIAGRIDARLDPTQVREPMLEELARAISVARHEPIDDGGVIALVGPTGAGKTTGPPPSWPRVSPSATAPATSPWSPPTPSAPARRSNCTSSAAASASRSARPPARKR